MKPRQISAGAPAAGDPLHRRVVVAPDPDRGDEAAGEADEPGVAVVAGGAGLAGQVVAGDLGPRAGAASHHLAHHLGHLGERRLADHRLRLAPVDAVVVEHLAAGGADALDAVGVDAVAAVGEGVIGLRPSPAGVTSTAPSAIEGSVWIGEVMPSRWAVAATLLVPTSLASRAATVLIDCASAVSRVIGPR